MRCMQKKNSLDDMFDFLTNEPDLDDGIKQQLLLHLQKLHSVQVNILITGATGSGKSSTINALFKGEKAKVGQTLNPETMSIEKFTLDNITLWDSPGLGHGIDQDKKHAKNITNKLYETDSNGDALIDIVLVILDGSNRDFGTTINLINNVILPAIDNDTKRLLVAMNKCDMALSGRHWDHENNQPKENLVKFLDEQVAIVKQRIYESTSVSIHPIYYSAGYKEDSEEQIPYNLSKLLMFIVQHTKPEKRAIYVNDINHDPKMWSNDDKLEDYRANTEKDIWKSVLAGAVAGGKMGGDIGSFLGPVGKILGAGIGTGLGALIGFLSS